MPASSTGLSGNQRFSVCSTRESENECVSQLTISEVARQVGLEPSAIRYYEHLGILPRADRCSGQRRYDRTVLYRLAVVQRARQAGFTLEEIKTLFVGFAEGTSRRCPVAPIGGPQVDRIECACR